MLDPNVIAYKERGLAYTDLGEYDKALEDFAMTQILSKKTAKGVKNETFFQY